MAPKILLPGAFAIEQGLGAEGSERRHESRRSLP
jgi:hypothetical protein